MLASDYVILVNSDKAGINNIEVRIYAYACK